MKYHRQNTIIRRGLTRLLLLSYAIGCAIILSVSLTSCATYHGTIIIGSDPTVIDEPPPAGELYMENSH